jgi:aerobic-type carbon monoxide dehydrogenase small subunit (CoxS/CutS family)
MHQDNPSDAGASGATSASGVSRRKFIQGGAAAAGAVALVLPAAAQDASPDAAPKPVRAGLKRYLASGQAVTLSVNGQAKQLQITPNITLLEALRENLDLTGTKQVCDRGSCGACTVLLDGRSVNSCLTLAVDAIGKQITTVEGLSKDDQLDPVQKAFCEHDASQCGYCIPGFVVRSKALLSETPNPTKDQVKEGLCGNICRCAAYTRIFEAVEAAGKKGGAA